ncbi:outer membrane protein OmpA-like peptidoglycan-associated protein [Kordia periserrulae]|uniref:Outer membrane protein OmpA-like peptidoglycan-associated protein n=1 Tax=Kordia periserrulae TaxID=701523 RepID=A0A2T6C6W3_9FLAO|nr:OmpA family protein [Kordia periserrulae]PTX64027.1 outer membrane protein OmpA-like peptidoglycan-associated protein [Kordia periserrulae]
MKKLYILLLVLATSNVFAQNDKTKKADKLYNRLEYVKAAEEYQEIAIEEADAYVYEQLANCYYNLFKTEEAERWYRQTIAEGNTSADVYFKYAQMLKANGKYQEHNEWMAKFAAKKPNDKRAIAFNENPNYIPQILAKVTKFEVKNSEINTQNSDFGALAVGSTVYFTSTRDGGRKYGWNDQPYLDIYMASYSGDGELSKAVSLSDDINTKYHEGTVSFSPDGKTMYFTRESYYDGKFKKDEEGKGTLNLYTATMSGGEWTNVQPVPFNNDEYSVGHPAVSADGKTLYFASDMPGGLGQSDLYKVAINDDGTFGEPENLGGDINTEGREFFPYVSSNNTLYFSSDGHLGIGGLDVFAAKIKDDSYGAVRNLGTPLNSNSDDFSFTFDEESKKGFVASNREGGKGSDDIYEVDLINPICDVDYIITVTDKETGAALSGAMVILADTQGNNVGSKTTDADGKVVFKVECDKSSVLEASIQDYVSQRVEVNSGDDPEQSIDIALEPIEEIIEDVIVLNPIYFEFDKHNITKEAAFELDKAVNAMNKYPNMVIKVESHTDNRGSAVYNQKLSERRAKSTVQYIISQGIDASRLSSEGKGEAAPLIDCGTKCTDEEHQQNRRSDFIIVSKD